MNASSNEPTAKRRKSRTPVDVPVPPKADDFDGPSAWLQRTIAGWGRVLALVAGALATALATFQIPSGVAKIVAWLVTLALVGVALLVVRNLTRARRLEAERAQRVKDFQTSRATRTAFRGLSSFTQEDFLLPGPQRRREAETLFTQISSDTFVFGIVSGDVGVGKTSLLNAGLIKLIQNGGFSASILPGPRDVWQAGDLEKVRIDAAVERLKNWIEIALPPKDKRRVLIIDQFEELFIRFRSKADRGLLGVFLKSLITGPSPLKIVCAVRRDFFVDFHDLAPELGNLFSARNTFVIRNFSTNEAEEVIRECASRDNITMPRAVPKLLANDLAEDDEIRPAELQIVCTALRGDFRLEHYQTEGGARAILAGHVALVIETSKSPPLTRMILRALCDLMGNAKAKPAEAASIVRIIGSKDNLVGTTEREVVAVLEQCEAERLVVRQIANSVTRWSLIHDYLVEPIKLGTQDASTKVEEAEKQLHGFLAEARLNKRALIPLRNLADLKAYGPRELLRRPETRRLIFRSYVAAYREPVFASIVAVVITAGVAAYFGTTPIWRLRNETRASSPVSIGVQDIASRLTVATTSSNDFTELWDGDTGKQIGGFEGKPLNGIYPRVILRRDEFSGSDFFAHFWVFNLETGDSKEIELYELKGILRGDPAWVIGQFLFVAASEISEAQLIIIDWTSEKIIRTIKGSFNSDLVIHVIDNDRLLLWKGRGHVPEIRSMSNGSLLGRFAVESKNPISVLAIDLEPETKRAVTVQEVKPIGAKERGDDDISDDENAVGSTFSIFLWELLPAEPRVVAEKIVDFDDLISQFVGPSSEGGPFYQAFTSLTKTTISVDLSIDKSSNSGSYLYDVNFHLLDKGIANLFRGTVFSTRFRRLVYYGQVDGSINLWDLQTGKRITVPGMFKENYRSLETNKLENRLLVGRPENKIELWDLEKGHRIAALVSTNVKAPLFTVEESAIGAWQDGGYLTLWTLAGQSMGSIPGIAGGSRPAVRWKAKTCEAIVWTTEGRVLTLSNEWDVLGLFRLRRHDC